MSASRARPRLRRWPLRLLVFGFAVLSLTGWMRLQQSIVAWNWLAGVGLDPGPLYIAVSGALTGLAGLVPTLGLATHRSWGPPSARLVAVLYALWYWIDRLVFTRNPYVLTGLPFAVAMTMLGLGLVFGILHRRRFPPGASGGPQ